jgi:type VI secretion system protein
MNQGLFESLTGQFLDGTPVESVPQKLRRVTSVMDHLNRMFNTRQGSISHLEGYGLPDVSDIYRRMPDAIDELRNAIKSTITRYEPRLENIRVVQRDEQRLDARLTFIITGELKGGGGMVRFQTMFNSIGNSSIAPWRKA